MECVLSSLASPSPWPSLQHHLCFTTDRASAPLLLSRGRAASLHSPRRFWYLAPAIPRRRRALVVCLGSSNDSSSSSSKTSTAAKIRSEVISPFRSVRMFFYLAFMASGTVGALISLPRLIAALGNAPNASPVMEVLTGLGIDLAAVLGFLFLYRVDVKARDQQIAKLSREETLAGLKLELKNKIFTIGQMRGVARLVIVAGPCAHIEEACRRSEPYISGLLERGVLAVPFATDGQIPNLQFFLESSGSKEGESGGASSTATLIQAEKLWRARPIYTGEWTKWLKEQKQLANVPEDSPVYLSLRLDGRVRGSGTGFPPWGAFVAQLPPLKGIWNGVLDGMDGRI